ncbi:MAG TPA: RNA methyltransferase [Phycisphaerae bacterium]|nr:RNA methyltransferase [Phycisphaerae bacterium]HOJ73447.1 RNA methyltransferase [Phycisphaerae bacterium]HOM51056.1 RNA methyltransferase [Phycisphaerae bacterium]HOQ86577.1 RNA methyltransferase [Phycisphaerae bacterium]HPP25715.1 RNA methyltransferase [Phycisphaerae bacterium]
MTNVRVVLVRPQIAGNIGAVARCMENFGAGPLVLVEPKVSPTHREAMQRSTHGEHRLHSARVVGTMAEALEGTVYAIAASRRPGPVHQADDLSPREMGQVLARHIVSGEVALLFGSEDNGLSREDLLACDAVVVIPAHPAYPTLNLSHAVAICLYEAFLAVATEKHTDATVRKRSEPADLSMMHRLMDKLQHALLTIGYLRPEKPDHLMFPIRAVLSRAELTRAEAQILMGLAQQIDEFARYGGGKR